MSIFATATTMMLLGLDQTVLNVSASDTSYKDFTQKIGHVSENLQIADWEHPTCALDRLTFYVSAGNDDFVDPSTTTTYWRKVYTGYANAEFSMTYYTLNNGAVVDLLSQENDFSNGQRPIIYSKNKCAPTNSGSECGWWRCQTDVLVDSDWRGYIKFRIQMKNANHMCWCNLADDTCVKGYRSGQAWRAREFAAKIVLTRKRQSINAVRFAEPFEQANCYIGCFEDDEAKKEGGERDLEKYMGRSYNGRSFSVETCRAACAAYKYFAIQDGNQCFCGNSYGNGWNSWVADSYCEKDGYGDYHGGSYRNSVYRVSCEKIAAKATESVELCPEGYVTEMNTDYEGSDIRCDGKWSIQDASAACTKDVNCQGFSMKLSGRPAFEYKPWCLKRKAEATRLMGDHYFCRRKGTKLDVQRDAKIAALTSRDCSAIEDEKTCLASKDSRDKTKGSPCAWCCGEQCDKSHGGKDDVGESKPRFYRGECEATSHLLDNVWGFVAKNAVGMNECNRKGQTKQPISLPMGKNKEQCVLGAHSGCKQGLDFGKKDEGCGCGKGTSCLEAPALSLAPFACANDAKDVWSAFAGDSRGRPYSKTCGQLKNEGWCTSARTFEFEGEPITWPLWMQRYCPKTCGHCKQDCALVDNKAPYTECVEKRRNHGCKDTNGRTFDWMRVNCGAVCGICKSSVCDVRPAPDTAACAIAQQTKNVCGVNPVDGRDPWWSEQCEELGADGMLQSPLCRQMLAAPKFEQGEASEASQCSTTCGQCRECSPDNCEPGEIFVPEECGTGAGNDGCIDLGQVLKFECLDLHMPSAQEIATDHCSPGMLEGIKSAQKETHSEPIKLELGKENERTVTRNTEVAFGNEHGWDLSRMDQDMRSWSDTTSVLIKDPEVMQGHGFKVGYAGISAEGEIHESFSCFNANTRSCYKGLGTWSVASNDEKCKCKETTATKENTWSKTHSTTVGAMQRQSQDASLGFAETERKYDVTTATHECPSFSDCFMGQYTSSAVCKIPYWGSCTATFAAKDRNGQHYTKEIAIERSETNVFHSIVRSQAFSVTTDVVTQKTDGRKCGVQLTPSDPQGTMVANQAGRSCPKINGSFEIIHLLPNCDCMLPQFQDCVTEHHKSPVLVYGDACKLGDRPTVMNYDDKTTCIESHLQWKDVASCQGADVFRVSGFNKEVYSSLKQTIEEATPKPNDSMTNTNEGNGDPSSAAHRGGSSAFVLVMCLMSLLMW